jgi:hypothetical protein
MINTQDNCGAAQREGYGEFVLETERIRDLGLGVEDDDPVSTEFSENHAAITGLSRLEDKKLAEDMATQLTSISAFHWDRFGKFI